MFSGGIERVQWRRMGLANLNENSTIRLVQT